MAPLANEQASILQNRPVGPGLHLLELSMPAIAQAVLPGQFIHMRIPGREGHILRRPFSIYDRDLAAGTCEILYQCVGSLTDYLPSVQEGTVEAIGPVGRPWSALERFRKGEASRALLVGGGVGAAPLHLLAKSMADAAMAFDVVLGAQTRDALVCLPRYEQLCPAGTVCSTDDGSFGHAGFCTALVEERLAEGCTADGGPYDYVAVCGPEPLMRIVSDLAARAGVYCELSLEKRMACGIGACLSCVVDTVDGKKRSCVDGPVFDSREVVWS